MRVTQAYCHLGNLRGRAGAGRPWQCPRQGTRGSTGSRTGHWGPGSCASAPGRRFKADVGHKSIWAITGEYWPATTTTVQLGCRQDRMSSALEPCEGCHNQEPACSRSRKPHVADSSAYLADGLSSLHRHSRLLHHNLAAGRDGRNQAGGTLPVRQVGSLAGANTVGLGGSVHTACRGVVGDGSWVSGDREGRGWWVGPCMHR